MGFWSNFWGSVQDVLFYILFKQEGKQNELQGFKNGELLRVQIKFIPKPYNFTEHMEYVMFNVDDREEIVIESETEIKSAVIRPCRYIV